MSERGVAPSASPLYAFGAAHASDGGSAVPMATIHVTPLNGTAPLDGSGVGGPVAGSPYAHSQQYVAGNVSATASTATAGGNGGAGGMDDGGDLEATLFMASPTFIGHKAEAEHTRGDATFRVAFARMHWLLRVFGLQSVWPAREWLSTAYGLCLWALSSFFVGMAIFQTWLGTTSESVYGNIGLSVFFPMFPLVTLYVRWVWQPSRVTACWHALLPAAQRTFRNEYVRDCTIVGMVVALLGAGFELYAELELYTLDHEDDDNGGPLVRRAQFASFTGALPYFAACFLIVAVFVCVCELLRLGVASLAITLRASFPNTAPVPLSPSSIAGHAAIVYPIAAASAAADQHPHHPTAATTGQRTTAVGAPAASPAALSSFDAERFLVDYMRIARSVEAVCADWELAMFFVLSLVAAVFVGFVIDLLLDPTLDKLVTRLIWIVVFGTILVVILRAMARVSSEGDRLVVVAQDLHVRVLVRSRAIANPAQRALALAVGEYVYAHVVQHPITYRVLSVDITKRLLVQTAYLLATLVFSISRVLIT